MTLVNPIGLLGLLSLPVIVFLHLLRRRQRRYVVSHLGLWSFLDTVAHGPRKRKIPITLILLLDLLIAALLSLAWAQPRLALNLPVNRARHMVILLDVSSSMNAREGLQQSRLAQAKTAAAALLDDTSPRDIVTVITFGRQAEMISDSRQDGAKTADRLQALQAGETGSALREALVLGQSALDKTLPAEFHIITDGSITEANQEVVRAFPYPLEWHLVGESANNQAVIELNATQVNQDNYQVFARIANFSDQTISREVILSVDGKPMNRTMVDLPAGSSLPQVWQIPVDGSSKLANINVSLAGTDSLVEDDTAAIGLQSGGSIRVALVADDPAVLQQAVQVIPGVEMTSFTSTEYAAQQAQQTLPAFDLTIYRGYQPAAWPAGQVLVVEPLAESATRNPVSSDTVTLYSQSGKEIPAGSAVRSPYPSSLTEGIDFSGVRWARVWNLASIPTGFSALLQADDAPILLQGELRTAANERSHVIVLLADLSRGNFTKHPAFPILMANLIEQSRQAPVPAGFQTGEAVPLPVTGSYESVEVTPPGKAPVELGKDWPPEWTNTLSPGLYRFRFVQMDGDVSEFSAGAKAGDAEESNLRPSAWAQSAASKNAIANEHIAQEQDPVDLRPWLLGAAILVLLMEANLAWRS